MFKKLEESMHMLRENVEDIKNRPKLNFNWEKTTKQNLRLRVRDEHQLDI